MAIVKARLKIAAFLVQLVGQMAKTPPFHGGVTSSILVRAIGNWLDKVRALISTVPRWGNLAQLVEHWCEVPS